MRTGLAVVLLLGYTASQTQLEGQQATTNGMAAGTNAMVVRQATPVSPLEAAATRLQLTPTTDTNSVEYLISRTKVRVSGPVASPLQGNSFGDVSKRVLHLFSPFSSGEPNVPASATGPAKTRAWSTIVGWSPGRSAFPDEHFHEPPQLRLISVSAEKQPKGDSD